MANKNKISAVLPTESFPDHIVTLDNQDAVTEVIKESVLGLWDVVNNLTRLRPAKNERYVVTIFGSARAQPGSESYEQTKELACKLASLGCDIVTGGGPGLMEAANQGAIMCGVPNKSRSIGVRIDLDFEQQANPFVSELYSHRTFFSRLHHFVLLSDAFVVVPGGIGTALELFMVWQLLQVRKLYNTPLLLLGPMWGDLVNWGKQHMLIPGLQLASDVDLDIPVCCEDVTKVIEIITEHHGEWVKRAAKGS